MGTIFKFHTDVDTDQIIASQYLLFPTIDEMKTHTFESLDPDFASKVKPGDFVVAAECTRCDCKIICTYFLPQLHQHRSSGHCLQRPV